MHCETSLPSQSLVLCLIVKRLRAPCQSSRFIYRLCSLVTSASTIILLACSRLFPNISNKCVSSMQMKEAQKLLFKFVFCTSLRRDQRSLIHLPENSRHGFQAHFIGRTVLNPSFKQDNRISRMEIDLFGLVRFMSFVVYIQKHVVVGLGSEKIH